jgi:hypothetical protein
MDVVHVVGAHDLEPELLGQAQQPRDDLPLFGDPMVLDLDEVVLPVAFRASSSRSLRRCWGTREARQPVKPIRPGACRARVSRSVRGL